ncbi:uncharacterized protein C8Q71DRAFT_280158 [Rhodofomes roseus]|uniref:Uncharacterized protein n=1 Tax=Rhodofomes roseus TaxID=34475 RepID=A0ABQ8K5M3_9APHY|nr:uncharacterized protein C8Q71DRAFT_280158 [Rhodofomes roseus]KAH9832062.1 hypothetical protein C8Q71DRAFT_280158 [Rhodofomes roseus]
MNQISATTRPGAMAYIPNLACHELPSPFNGGPSSCATRRHKQGAQIRTHSCREYFQAASEGASRRRGNIRVPIASPYGGSLPQGGRDFRRTHQAREASPSTAPPVKHYSPGCCDLWSEERRGNLAPNPISHHGKADLSTRDLLYGSLREGSHCVEARHGVAVRAGQSSVPIFPVFLAATGDTRVGRNRGLRCRCAVCGGQIGVMTPHPDPYSNLNRVLTEDSEQWPCDDFNDTLVGDNQHGDAGIPRDSLDSRTDGLPVVTGHGVEGRDYRPSNFSTLLGALGSQDIDIGYYHVNVSTPIGALATPTPDMLGSGADSGMKLESPSSITAAEGGIDGQYAFGVASSLKNLHPTIIASRRNQIRFHAHRGAKCTLSGRNLFTTGDNLCIYSWI